jgi:phosphoribosylformylglycinamidine synthase
MRIKSYPIHKFTNKDLIKLNEELSLALSLEELLAIRSYYQKEGRSATDVELYTFSQVWSEHCFHKTFKAKIKFGDEEIEGLFKTFIERATRELNKDWCLRVFEDNAGIIEFDDEFAIAVKVETHNHPTALDPFSGAHTGVGGVYRDIIGVGARPIATMDYLFFAYPNLSYNDLPYDAYHPKVMLKKVVAGIADYGNKVGVPTVNGCIQFNNAYLRNPLVFAGSVGLLPKNKYIRTPKPGHNIILLGGKTGRDGIKGASFASLSLTKAAESKFYAAVQIGNPIEEKKIIEAIIKARDHEKGPLYSLVTDLGGGGLAVAVCESFKDLGADIFLEKISLKHLDMDPWEIWISESQERMLLCVPEENLEEIFEIFEEEGCEASIIGEVNSSKKVSIKYKGEYAGEISLDFLFKEYPRLTLKASSRIFKRPEPPNDSIIANMNNYNDVLLNLLSDPNVSSKEWVIRQYDHEVGARTIIKPLQGVNLDAPGDAAVIKPLYNSWKGIVISNGGNPNYSIDPYRMALSAIDEAIRNNVACGGRRIALLDNFCWGNPMIEEELGKLVLACKACYEGAKSFDTPYISGKDSLYNEFFDGKVRHEIPPTLMITAVGVIPDVRKSVTMDFKRSGNYVYIIGFTSDELGGSLLYRKYNIEGGEVPNVNPERAKTIYEKITRAIDRGLIRSCHDCSDGGLAVAIAEMCIGGNCGVEINLDKVPTHLNKPYKILFSESNSRFIVEVAQGYEKEFEFSIRGIPFEKIGYVTSDKTLIFKSGNNEVINLDLDEVIRAFKTSLI